MLLMVSCVADSKRIYGLAKFSDFELAMMFKKHSQTRCFPKRTSEKSKLGNLKGATVRRCISHTSVHLRSLSTVGMSNISRSMKQIMGPTKPWAAVPGPRSSGVQLAAEINQQVANKLRAVCTGWHSFYDLSSEYLASHIYHLVYIPFFWYKLKHLVLGRLLSFLPIDAMREFDFWDR